MPIVTIQVTREGLGPVVRHLRLNIEALIEALTNETTEKGRVQ